MYKYLHMSTTISVRIDLKTKKRLEAIARSSNRSKSFLAAEAIAAYVEAEEWQIGEIRSSMKELDGGDAIGHDKAAAWLQSWGKRGETKAPK